MNGCTNYPGCGCVYGDCRDDEREGSCDGDPGDEHGGGA